MKKALFNSVFAPMLYAFHEKRITEGYVSSNRVYYLEEFDRMVMNSGFRGEFITKELIHEWDLRKPYLENSTKIVRHNTIRAFCAFAFARDGQSYVPDTSRIRNTTTFIPYIFTKEEIRQILSAADRIPKRKNAPLREIVLPAVFRLLYCCGLRVNESLQLRKADFDTNTGVLSVKNAKGGKDRLIPLHDDMSEYLRSYCRSIPVETEWLFPSAKGHYSPSTVYANFRELLRVCKIPHTGRGPRVHDLRHTFCVHTLETQLAAGYEPMQIMPRMAAYLGHKSYRETSWYIHLTIISFPELSEKLSTAFRGIIPVSGGEYFEEN